MQTVSFKTELQKIKYLGMNLTKEVKDIYMENYKTLVKEIEDDSKKWKYIPCSLIRRINIVKIVKQLKAIYRFKVIPLKFPGHFS